MSEEVKFTKEEIDRIDDFQVKYSQIRDDFGGICLSKINLRNRIDELDKFEDKLSTDFRKIQNDENKFIDELNEKYGEGSLDPKTGVFTPIEKNKSEKTK